jgi:c-di-GMP-binding flagellar brake protein YcgR
MISVTGIEKRRTKRFEIAQEVSVARNEREFVGLTQNVSLGGMRLRVELDPPVRIGDRLSVAITIPQLPQPLRAEAEVRWQNKADKATIGVQFLTGFRAKETWALGQFLEANGRVE